MLPAPSHAAQLRARQLWGGPYRSISQICHTSTLDAGGVITLGPSSTITLSYPAIFKPNQTCYAGDPFYASSWVFIYVLATCTTIAWILFSLLLITQRTFHPARASTSTRWANRGLATVIAGRTPLGGLGTRPWLQKAAALLVSAGLTVASVEALKQAGFQNAKNITNAVAMRDDVSGSEAVRIMRVISGVFVWLAQVQTLMRLFPRRKEKLVIKWLSFVLILCDLVFSCLNSFYEDSKYSHGSPRDYQDAIPALSYLFQLSISLLYAAWVLYYAATKRRYAFFRPDQLNMSIIALFALVSIAIPVAFFVADISLPAVAGWGDFYRWAAGAAASVIVWEWVDRIEATEREERKDGILGREVFDEDELSLSETQRGSADSSSGQMPRHLNERAFQKNGFLPHISFAGVKTRLAGRTGEELHASKSVGDEKRAGRVRLKALRSRRQADGEIISGEKRQSDPNGVLPPPSRENTESVDSTVYAVDYHPVTATPPMPRHLTQEDKPSDETAPQSKALHGEFDAAKDAEADNDLQHINRKRAAPRVLGTDSIPGIKFAFGAFKRHKSSPPVEVKRIISDTTTGSEAKDRCYVTKDVLPRRLRALRSAFANSIASSDNPPAEEALREPTVIPAPPRGHTWSPEVARHSPVDPQLKVNGVHNSLQVHAAVRHSVETDLEAHRNVDDVHQDRISEGDMLKHANAQNSPDPDSQEQRDLQGSPPKSNTQCSTGDASVPGVPSTEQQREVATEPESPQPDPSDENSVEPTKGSQMGLVSNTAISARQDEGDGRENDG